MGKNDRIILIDADVVSHFIYANEQFALSSIFKNKIFVLDKVLVELRRFPKKRDHVNALIKMKVLAEMPFPETNPDIKKEYSYIKDRMCKGDGESACLAVVRYTNNIIASSNLRDIKNYCIMHKVDYLSTMDFLCHALNNKLWTEERCDKFIASVLASGNKLPCTCMKDHACKVISFL